MRWWAADAHATGYKVQYIPITDASSRQRTFEEKLSVFIKVNPGKALVHFEIEDKFMEKRIHEFAERMGLENSGEPVLILFAGVIGIALKTLNVV